MSARTLTPQAAQARIAPTLKRMDQRFIMVDPSSGEIHWRITGGGILRQRFCACQPRFGRLAFTRIKLADWAISKSSRPLQLGRRCGLLGVGFRPQHPGMKET